VEREEKKEIMDKGSKDAKKEETKKDKGKKDSSKEHKKDVPGSFRRTPLMTPAILDC
jgi:hypothetical protein